MPTSELPTSVNEPTPDPESGHPESGQPESTQGPGPAVSPVVRGSRWVDYDTHELLEMIGELEDERRWARLREGVLWAILLHALVILALALLPRYIFQPRIIEPKVAANDHKDWTYLDTPIERPKNPALKTPLPAPVKPPMIDKQTLEAMNKATQPPPAPAPAPPAPAAVQPPVPPPIPPNQQSQSQLEAPRPAAVPARPSFAMNSENPADQLREAMRNASRNPGSGNAGNLGGSGLARHPGAGGDVQILSDQQGVDFRAWLQRWHRETEITWDPLIPDEVNPPLLKSGMVAIRFKVLPNGRLMDGSLQLEGRSGDTALDRAAWGALTGSNYPPLPRDFHGPYLELRAFFLYNMEPPK
jgi:hypothetical protein